MKYLQLRLNMDKYNGKKIHKHKNRVLKPGKLKETWSVITFLCLIWNQKKFFL